MDHIIPVWNANPPGWIFTIPSKQGSDLKCHCPHDKCIAIITVITKKQYPNQISLFHLYTLRDNSKFTQ